MSAPTPRRATPARAAPGVLLTPEHDIAPRWWTIILALLWCAAVVVIYYRNAPGALADGDWRLSTLLELGAGGWRFPYLGSALKTDAVAVGSALALLASAVLTGLAIARAARWRFDSALEQLPIAASLGIGALAYAGLALAAVGLYRPWVLRALTLVPLTGGGVWWLRHGGRLALAGRYAEDRHAVRGMAASAADDRAWMWVAVTVAAMLLAFVAALAPEIEYDAVWFHLYFPRLFLQHGRLVDIPSQYISLYPMTWELWFGYGMSFGGQTTAKLLQFACLPLTAVVVYATARRYARGANAWIAVALFATTPLVMWSASTAYVDLALAMYVALVMYALARYAERRGVQWLCIAAVNLGLGLATKHLMLLVLPLICPGLALVLWWRERARRRRRRIARALWPPTVLGAASLLVPLPWYLRSWRSSGNPVFPELYSMFGAPESRWNALSQAGLERFMRHFGRSRTAEHLLTLPWHMTMHAAYYDGTLGVLFLCAVPLLLLPRPRRHHPGERAARAGSSGTRARRTLAALAAFAIGYGVLWASPVSSFQMRWLIPVVPALAVLGAVGVARLAEAVRGMTGRPRMPPLAWALILLLALDLPLFTMLHEGPWDHARHDRVWSERDAWLNSTLHGVPLGVVLGAETREAYIDRSVPTARAWRFMGHALPSDALVLEYGGGDELYRTRPGIWALAASVRQVAFAPVGDTAAALAAAGALGITHVLIDKRFLRSNGFPDSTVWSDFALAAPSTRARDYDLLYEDDRALVFRIRPSAVAARFTHIGGS
ncbi:MAG TPA: glycosyltransferase family 39 protein [Gemmatimonadaceae bacterium]|nr:glycosyltransferase family 39 protein [Gemmatimonadaceae bacterium]